MRADGAGEKIEPLLPFAIDWDTFVLMLEHVDTLDELQSAAQDPQAFAEGLGDDVLVTIIRNVAIYVLINAGVDPLILEGIGAADDEDCTLWNNFARRLPRAWLPGWILTHPRDAAPPRARPPAGARSAFLQVAGGWR